MDPVPTSVIPFVSNHSEDGFLEACLAAKIRWTITVAFGRIPSQLAAGSFISAIHNLELSLSPDFQNPCNSPMLRKLFRPKITTSWNIIEKDAVDEIIFRSSDPSRLPWK